MTLARFGIGFLIFLSSLGSASGHAACYQPLKSRLPGNGIVLFGELHGTTEIPQFFLDCVREFVLNRENVEVFLEIDIDENENLRKFSAGQISEAEFLQAPHWSRTDGRASLAMLALIRALREMPGGPVTARGFDTGNPDRERAMMLNLQAQRDER